MSRKKPPKLGSQINNAIAINEKKIEEAKESIVNQEKQGNIQLIGMDSIEELTASGKTMHNRTTFNKENIKKFALSIKENIPNGILDTGLLHPIVLRKKEGRVGEYERVTGFRRYLAFQYNKEVHIPAIVIEVDDKTARGIRHSENADREKLNELDELISVLESIAYTIDYEYDQLISFIKNSVKHLDKSKPLVFNNIEEEVLKSIEIKLNKISNYGGITGLNKRLILLSMDEMVLEEVYKNNITFTNANEINKVKAYPVLVKDLLLFNKDKNPTQKQLIAEIKRLKQSTNGKLSNPITSMKDKFSEIKSVSYNKIHPSDKDKVDLIINKIDSNILELNELFNKK